MSVFNRIIRMLVLSVIFVFYLTDGAAAESPKVDIEYYFYARCISCNEGEDIRRSVTDRMKRDFPDVEINLNIYNTAEEDNLKKLEREFERRGIDKERLLIQPVVFVGWKYMSGALEIADELSNAVGGYLSGNGTAEKRAEIDEGLAGTTNQTSLDTPANANENHENTVESDKTEVLSNNKKIINIKYLYAKNCNECDKTDRYINGIDTIKGKNGEEYVLKVERLDAGDVKKLKAVNVLYDMYNVPESKRKVPMVIYNKGYFVGYEEISDNLTNILNLEQPYTVNNIQDAEKLENKFSNKILIALVSGVVSGFSPCTISLLLLLLSLLIADKKRIIWGGCGFLTGRMIAYFLMGTVFYKFVRSIDSQIVISLRNAILWAMIVICTVLAFIYIVDFILILKGKNGKTILQLSPRLKKLYENKIVSAAEKNKLFVPTMMAGVSVAVGEFMCTGQVFAANVLYSFSGSSVGYSIFGVYSIAVSLPSIVLLILVYVGKSYADIACVVTKYEGLIKLLMIVLLVGFIIMGIKSV